MHRHTRAKPQEHKRTDSRMNHISKEKKKRADSTADVFERGLQVNSFQEVTFCYRTSRRPRRLLGSPAFASTEDRQRQETADNRDKKIYIKVETRQVVGLV